MLTLTAINVDIGSISGHTRPSDQILTAVRGHLERARELGVLLNFGVRESDHDINLVMVHDQGNSSTTIHNLAWDLFEKAVGCFEADGALEPEPPVCDGRAAPQNELPVSWPALQGVLAACSLEVISSGRLAELSYAYESGMLSS